MNLPENTFVFFVLFVFRVHLCQTFSIKLLLFKINLLFIFTLTDFKTDNFHADVATLCQLDVRS